MGGGGGEVEWRRGGGGGRGRMEKKGGGEEARVGSCEGREVQSAVMSQSVIGLEGRR